MLILFEDDLLECAALGKHLEKSFLNFYSVFCVPFTTSFFKRRQDEPNYHSPLPDANTVSKQKIFSFKFLGSLNKLTLSATCVNNCGYPAIVSHVAPIYIRAATGARSLN